MKKNMRKCPNCGAMMPADMRYCRKCNASMDSGRVGTLPRRNDRKGDALRDLPKPVRPTEELEHPEEEGTGFFSPDRGDGLPAPERQGRVSYDDRAPRPVQTARGGPSADRDGRDRRMWQIAAVLAIILVIIVVAIILVVKLNQRPAQEGQAKAPSPEFQVAETTASPAPSNSPTPTIIPAPTNTPFAPAVVTTPIVAATPSPVPSPSNSPLPYTIQDVNETVYLTGSGVNIRKGPGTDFDVIGSASTGQYYTRTGRVSNGWSRISYSGGDAYISDSFLSTTQPTASPAPVINVTAASGTVTVTSDANLRKGPGTNYDSIGVVSTGTQLTRTGYTDSWTRVQYNGAEYYIFTNLVSDGSGSSGGATTTSGTVTITGNMVNIRSGPGTDYNAIGQVNSGTVLTCTGQSGDWYQVSYNGTTGYVISTYATKN